MSDRSRGPAQFTSRIRAKYAGVRGNVAGHDSRNVRSLIDRSGFVARSSPSVDVCFAPLPAEQNEPPPWVGSSGVSSGQIGEGVVQRLERLAGQALGELGSRQVVRAAPPTISAPPLNSTGVASPSCRTT